MRYLATDYAEYIREAYIFYNMDTKYLYRCGCYHSSREVLPDKADGVLRAANEYAMKCFAKIQDNPRYRDLLRHVECTCNCK